MANSGQSGQTQSELLIMKDIKSARPFKFGNSRVVHSTKKVKIPVMMGQTRCHIETEVVPVDIPLLLSKTSLKSRYSFGH